MWQPISTAPMDGREIIGYDMATETSHVTWRDGSQWYDPDNHYYSQSAPFNPTHWMPLPPPPEAV